MLRHGAPSFFDILELHGRILSPEPVGLIPGKIPGTGCFRFRIDQRRFAAYRAPIQRASWSRTTIPYQNEDLATCF
jgi:hypothetical protein